VGLLNQRVRRSQREHDRGRTSCRARTRARDHFLSEPKRHASRDGIGGTCLLLAAAARPLFRKVRQPFGSGQCTALLPPAGWRAARSAAHRTTRLRASRRASARDHSCPPRRVGLKNRANISSGDMARVLRIDRNIHVERSPPGSAHNACELEARRTSSSLSIYLLSRSRCGLESGVA
jgi:hypothetical protein